MNHNHRQSNGNGLTTSRALQIVLLVPFAISMMDVGRKQVGAVVQELQSDLKKNNDIDSKDFSASTGTLFSGTKIRSFPGKLRLQTASKQNVHLRTTHSSISKSSNEKLFPRMTDDCDRWAVVTTINPPKESVRSVAALKDWCLVIVGDTKTPNDYLKQSGLGLEGRSGVVFLSASQQQGISHPFVQRIPFQSFARKNVGFLFAIRHGAKMIYDFDDDNIFLDQMAPMGNLERRSLPVRYTTNHRHAPSSAFNPLPYMNPTEPNVWPRGYPLKDLARQLPADDIAFGSIDFSSVGVIQAVCNEDPDFDAVYRLTRTSLPVHFDNSPKAQRLLVPRGKYAPYNAQATTHMYNAFWGLLLPWTVSGRVTDIWRSYFTQRILFDLNLALVYELPLVRHDRSPHNYTADMQADNALYMKTSALLEFLSNWKDHDASTTYLPARIERLTVALYERDYIGLDDVYGMQEWLLALLDVGYAFPVVPQGSVMMENSLRVNVEPNLEGQVYVASPAFNVGKDGRTYQDHIEKTGLQGSENLFNEWLKGGKVYKRPSEETILKLVIMTKNEWPLLKDWILYHGELLGFENLYVLDGSTDKVSIAFLKYARDNLGANVLFSSANLNDLENQLSEVGKEISKASDFVIKMDTDEFLTAYTGDASCSYANENDSAMDYNCTLSPYSVKDTINQLQDVANGYRLKIGYTSDSNPNPGVAEICNAGEADNIGAFPLGDASPVNGFKTVSDSRTLTGLDLGGHKNYFAEPFAPAIRSGEPTNLSILHFHWRCLEHEVSNCRKAMVSHGWISEQDTDDVAKEKLLNSGNLKDVKDVCQLTQLTGKSGHKRLFFAQWLAGCITADNYYQGDSGKVNLDFQKFLSDAKSKPVIGACFQE
jgi:hypothetical protein